MSEIRITVSDKLEEIVDKISTSVGMKPTEYIKGLILQDLKERGIKDE